METIILPYKALYPVAGHRIANLAAHGYSYPADRTRACCPKNEKTGGIDFTRPIRKSEKIGPLQQAFVFGKREQRNLPRSICSLPDAGSQTKDYLLAMVTARRLRPLARRRFITSLPFLVDIRTRKPWVRFREVLLG